VQNHGAGSFSELRCSDLRELASLLFSPPFLLMFYDNGKKRGRSIFQARRYSVNGHSCKVNPLQPNFTSILQKL